MSAHRLAKSMTRGVDRSDLYFQHSRYESWLLEDGIVKEGTHSIEQGVGVRALSGEAPITQSLSLGISEQIRDLGAFLNGAPPLAGGYGDLVPSNARDVERQLYLTDMETLIGLLRVEGVSGGAML